MSTAKVSITRGQKEPDIVIASGSSISGSDALFVNFDVTNMTKAEAVILLDQVKLRILKSGWPLL